jgi:plasmid maintenance system killer protein
MVGRPGWPGSFPQSLWRVAARKLESLDSAEALPDLRVPPGNRLEALKGDRAGQHSILINEQPNLLRLERRRSGSSRDR